MSLQMCCARCLAPTIRIDPARYPLVPATTFCRSCASHALISAVLSDH